MIWWKARVTTQKMGNIYEKFGEQVEAKCDFCVWFMAFALLVKVKYSI